MVLLPDSPAPSNNNYLTVKTHLTSDSTLTSFATLRSFSMTVSIWRFANACGDESVLKQFPMWSLLCAA